MVESTNTSKLTTQLPEQQQKVADEESKDSATPQKLMMEGTPQETAAAVKEMLGARLQLNMLESGLIDRYMSDPATCEENMVKLITTLQKKHADNRGAAKPLSKALALFEKHQFWDSQPVPRYADYVESSDYNKPIKVQTLEEISKEALPLPKDFEWCNLDLKDEAQAQELYTLLTNHYVEDSGGRFRFDYSIDFLRWALDVPEQHPEWLVGIRGVGKQNLSAFISAIPVTMHVNGEKIQMAEVNFLCSHKKLREKRIAPVLIQEITRRVNLKGIFQAMYTSGTILPTPVSFAPYWHRNLNPKKLVEVGFSHRPADVPMSRFVKMHRLANDSIIPNIRPMELRDVPAVTEALNAHLFANYKLHISYTEDEVKHFLLPREGVVHAYLVTDKAGKVTDFTSFYNLPSSILNHEKYNKLDAAYGFYSFTADSKDLDRFNDLMKDALFFAQKNNFDVFNLTEVMQHRHVIDKNQFKAGDGNLAHYLYNWRIQSLPPADVGIVLV